MSSFFYHAPAKLFLTHRVQRSRIPNRLNIRKNAIKLRRIGNPMPLPVLETREVIPAK